MTYEFDSELATRTINEALNAVQYAHAVKARKILIQGYRAATLLSDGTLAREIPEIGRLRVQELREPSASWACRLRRPGYDVER